MRVRALSVLRALQKILEPSFPFVGNRDLLGSFFFGVNGGMWKRGGFFSVGYFLGGFDLFGMLVAIGEMLEEGKRFACYS